MNVDCFINSIVLTDNKWFRLFIVVIKDKMF